MNQYIIYGVVLFCAILGSFGQLFFKIGVKPFNVFILLSGMVCYGIAMVLFTWMLRYGDLHILYPIIATSYVFVTIFSIYILKESVTIYQWLGILLILLGVGIITFK